MRVLLKLPNRSIEFNHSSPILMGILNVTPDSFSDGGRFIDSDLAVSHALSMLDEGAAIIDVGGESTRPGSTPISSAEETDRVAPVIEKIKKRRPDCVISIDTTKPEVASAALKNGADLINDISGLKMAPELANVASEHKAGLIISHMRGTPQTMQNPENLVYDNLLEDISRFLEKAARRAIEAGVDSNAIILDPGIGFSKDKDQNLKIINEISTFHKLGFPLLVGPSRKSFIGLTLDIEDPKERDWGTLGTCFWLHSQGVQILRVHHIKGVSQAFKMFEECGKKAINSQYKPKGT